MEFIPAPKVVQAELVFSVGTSIAENVFNFLCPNQPVDSDLQAIGDFLEVWWIQHYKLLQQYDVIYSHIHMRDMGSRESIMRDFVPGSTQHGSRNGSPILPMNVTVAVNYLTNLAGRSCRGRGYFVGLAEDQVTGDGINETVRTEIAACFQELIGHATNAGYTWVVCSRHFNGVARAQAATFPITGIKVGNVVCSQKRRLSGRGQ